MASKKIDLKAELMKALGCKQEQSIFPRLKAMKLLDVCGRCLGSGEYSFNLMHGTVCFKCNGARYTMPKITKELVQKAAELWTPEFVAAYTAKIQAVEDAKKKVAGARGLYLKSAVVAEWDRLADTEKPKAGWMAQAEHMEANYPELDAKRTALHRISEKIKKILGSVVPETCKMWDAQAKAWVPLDWVALNEKLAPLIAEFEAMDRI